MRDSDSGQAEFSSAELKAELNHFLEKQPRRFTFLLMPESYLLGACIMSGLAALPFLVLNGMAISCVLSSCAALEDESNTLLSWVIFESITGLFLITSVLSGIFYFRLRPERVSDRTEKQGD